MAELTIDELARAVGMTARNVRSHQTRGLLPGPTMRGRTGYYDDEHVERLELIKELQDEGLPLRLVERLLTTRGETAGRILALRRTVLAGLEQTENHSTTVAELTERFGSFDEESFQIATSIGAIIPHADGTLGLPNPALLDTAAEVMSYGIPLAPTLRIAQHVHTACHDAAQVFVDLVRDEVWLPFDEAGRPEEDWPRISSTIERIRPLASQVFVQMLPAAIASEIERVFGEELREQAQAS
ncbi:MAG: MerR family transcriptional regulator [Solirubrobacteraceae bacterium]|nr:MerR family transcriptional regulator [Solirubrobacteraceae bacterium]